MYCQIKKGKDIYNPLIKYLFRTDSIMKKTFRRRRHTSNWLYAILAGSILLITLCIISLIPSAIDGEQQPEQSDSSGLAGTITPTPPSYITPAPAHIRITINPGKLSLL